MKTEHPHLLVDERDSICRITFNRPEKLNCFTDEMLDALTAMLVEIEYDDNIKVVILKGSGRCFSTGYDIAPKGMRPLYGDDGGEWDSDYARRWANRRYAYLDQVWALPKPVIAQVHGYCLAGASDLANTCDLTVASEDATFGYPALRWGGHTHRLTYAWNLPMKIAKQLMFTGDSLTAQQALHYGMINTVVPIEQLEAETESLAQRISMTALSGLIVNKISLNHTYELMGYRNSMTFTNQIANTNMFRKNQFHEISREQGLKAALDDRDTKFANSDSGSH